MAHSSNRLSRLLLTALKEGSGEEESGWIRSSDNAYDNSRWHLKFLRVAALRGVVLRGQTERRPSG